MGSRAGRVAVLAGLVLLGGSGCATGILYSHVTRPLDLDLDRTPVHEGYANNSRSTVQYYARIDWGSTGLGDVSKELGLKRIHYADLETLSILGIFTRRKAHIYGER